MFDNVKFEGTINLGALVVAIIQLLSAYTVLIRIRALIEERDIRFNPFKYRKPKPPAPVIPPAETDVPSTKVPDDKLN